MTPSSSSAPGSNVEPSSVSSLATFTMAYSFRKILVNPRFGKRRCSGICPPSNPRMREYPETDLAPLAPRPENFPRPEPIPCPTRCCLCFCPLGGLSWLRFIRASFIRPSLFHYSQQVRNFLHHAAEGRGIRPLHHTIHFLQSQRSHNYLVLLGCTDDAADQLDLDRSRHILSDLLCCQPTPLRDL